MALRLISTLSILVLASFAYKVWDKTKVPEDISPEDVWKVKTIEFVCRIISKILSLLLYLNVDVHAVGRPIQSFAFNTMHYGIWPVMTLYQPVDELSVTAYHREMNGVPVIMFQSDDIGSSNGKQFRQKREEPKAIVIYYHGGGWVWMDAEDPMPTLRMLTQELHIDTISVEYRLAPQFPYPAALEDCVAVTNYVIQNHKELGVDPDKIIIAGDNAGGNLAAAVALRLKKKVRLQVLIYPALQAFDFQSPSYRENNGILKYILSPNAVIECVAKYGAIPHTHRQALLDNKHISQSTRRSRYRTYTHSNLIPVDMNITKLASLSPSSMPSAAHVEDVESVLLDPYFMPLMAESLEDVADAYIVTAQHDPLRDDGLFYAARLKNTSEVKVKLENYRDGFHAFFHFSQGPLKLNSARRAISNLIDYIDDNVIKMT